MNSPRFLLADDGDENRIFVIHFRAPRFIAEVLFNGAWSRGHFKLELFFIEPHHLSKEEHDALIRAAENYYSLRVRGVPCERREPRSRKTKT